MRHVTAQFLLAKLGCFKAGLKTAQLASNMRLVQVLYSVHVHQIGQLPDSVLEKNRI